MAYISDIIFCYNATCNKDSGINAERVMPNLVVPYIPGVYSFYTIITVLDIEFDVEHDLNIKIISPIDKETANINKGFHAVDNSDSTVPKKYRGVNITINWLNINFPIEGLYKMIVSLNGIQLKEKEIYVAGSSD